MGESFAKKERNKNKAKKKEQKAQKLMDRKQSGTKSSFEDMIAYVDEYGNLTDQPVNAVRTEIKLEDIQLGAAKLEVEVREYEGVLASYDPLKGYGFITESVSGNKIFVHRSSFLDPIKENDLLVFEQEKGPRGYSAVQVRKK